ncbi:MAG TPA: carboxypeptidase-like regulatory domain-containing protein [Bryobacteraceae bacterium]|nr:carboxypeptidase-like regulatory domain-containing protein [Bryobacteraceae bacterium]
MKWSSFIGVLIVSLTLVCALPAQKKKDKEESSTRTLQGLVTDKDGNPASGAVVQLKDLRTLQIRSFITKDDGAYFFSGLKVDDDYQVKADWKGLSSDSKRLSVFDSRKTATINLKLEKKESPDRDRSENHP